MNLTPLITKSKMYLKQPNNIKAGIDWWWSEPGTMMESVCTLCIHFHDPQLQLRK